MGIIRNSLSFIAGAVAGVYVSQNYNVPNINKLYGTALDMARQMEQRYRKRSSKHDNDDK